MKYKWLAEKDSWLESSEYLTFSTYKGAKLNVGDRIGNKVILSIWVNEEGYCKAVKSLCDCGNVVKYERIGSIKLGHNSMRIDCRLASSIPNICVLHKKYGVLAVRRAREIWAGMFKRVKSSIAVKYSIGVHDKWADFGIFIEYIVKIEGYDTVNLVIDRINTYKGYEPGNIRFVTNVQNMRNRRDTIFVMHKGTRMSVMDFMETELGVTKHSDEYGIYMYIKKQAKLGRTLDNIMTNILSTKFKYKITILRWAIDITTNSIS